MLHHRRCGHMNLCTMYISLGSLLHSYLMPGPWIYLPSSPIPSAWQLHQGELPSHHRSDVSSRSTEPNADTHWLHWYVISMQPHVWKHLVFYPIFSLSPTPTLAKLSSNSYLKTDDTIHSFLQTPTIGCSLTETPCRWARFFTLLI